MKKGLITCLSIILLLAISLYLVFNGNPIHKKSLNKTVKEYLISRYREEMTIINVDYIFETRTYFAKVFLNQRPTIEFNVYELKDKSFSDGYFMAVLQEEVNQMISTIMSEVYGLECSGSLYFSQGGLISYDDYIISNGVPSFFSIKDRITTSMFATVKVNRDFDSKNQLVECEKIYQVLTNLFNDFKVKDVTYRYSDLELYICNDDFRDIKSVDEIIKFFK